MGFWERLNQWAKRSITLKIISIGFVVLVLLIPTSLLNSLVNERQQLRDGAIKEVSSKWGGSQTLGGPVLTVPFLQSTLDDRGKKTQMIKYAHFLPDTLAFEGTMQPEKRYRGIYVVVLYHSNIHVSGHFGNLNLKAINEPVDQWLWDESFISFGISDMKGIKNQINFSFNDSTYEFGPGIPIHDIFTSGISFPIKIDPKALGKFSLDLDLNGSSYLHFLPLGKKTTVALKSPWTNPSFEGSFLPEERSIEKDGFKANWKVLQLNRNFPQQGVGSFVHFEENTPTYSDPDEVYVSNPVQNTSAFGVKLLLPIDEYKKTLRSTKYGVMFLILTFTTFFFLEVLNKKRLHPIQYLLVGFAICLFYVLLLSISEHTSFDIAYLIGCGTISALIIGYCHPIFKKFSITALIAAQLLILYGFFYSLLQLEDYSLLLGSLGLLVILASVMYLTRSLDWYNHGKDEPDQP